MTLIEKARAGRMAALASLETAEEKATNVVSIFDFEPRRKPTPQPVAENNVIPAFHSVRREGEVIRLAA